MSQEKNLTICKKCNEIKLRIVDGKYNKKDKRYVDEHGKMWNGLTCPECYLKISKERMRNKRVKPDA